MKIILRNTNLVFQSENFDVDVFIDTQVEVENPEFKSVITDTEDKIIWGRYVNNTTTDIDLTGYFINGDMSIQSITNPLTILSTKLLIPPANTK